MCEAVLLDEPIVQIQADFRRAGSSRFECGPKEPVERLAFEDLSGGSLQLAHVVFDPVVANSRSDNPSTK